MPRKYKKKNTNKKYSESNFQLAVELVEKGFSIRAAAKKFVVPYTTLNSHVNNEILYDRVGRPTKFSVEEEDHLQQAALLLQDWGVPLTIDEFINLSKQYASSLNKMHLFPSGTPTYDWLYSFLNRHQNLILKKSYPLEKKRAALTCEQVDDWFQLLNKIILENDLANRPAQIFNSDESGMSDNISYSKVIVHRHTSNAYRIQGGTGGKSFTSVMFCGSATGVLLPPFIIYKSKRLLDEWCVGGPSDAGYDCSENGWMDQTLFYRWFDQIFLEHTKNLPRPLLLIVDGHGSHFDVETLKLAVRNEVIILCLPSNATHILQPLDIVFFNPLKIQWKKILRDEYTRTHFKNIGKSQFPSLLKQMWIHDPIGTKTNVLKSFVKAGIFPFNPNSIDRSRILKNNRKVNKHISNVPTNSTNDNQTTTETTTIDIPSSLQATTSSFTSSHQAITILDRVLEETKSINSSIEDLSDDEDEEYCPPKSTFTSSASVSSNKQQKSQPGKIVTTKDHQSVLLQQEKKRKRKSSIIIGFSTSEEDDDENFDLSMSRSQQAFKTKHELQPKKVLPLKHHQPMSSEEQKKRMKLALQTVGFDTSDEDDLVPNSSTSNPQKSLQAITDAIQTVFGTPSNRTPKQPSKRTVLNRSNGQIITEKIVIEQLEERKNKQKSKRAGSNSRTTNETKRKKHAKNEQRAKLVIPSFKNIDYRKASG